MRLPVAVAFCAMLLVPVMAGHKEAVSARTSEAHVMILGTFHFVRGQQDMFRVNAGDVLAPKRQMEIGAAVALLREYHPTVIAVEAPFGDEKLQKNYQAYCAGTYNLSADEIDQIGFRLAKQLGHPKVYGVDSKSDMDFDRVMQFAQSHGQAAAMQKIAEAGEAFTNDLDAELTKSSITDVLRKMNLSDELQLNHELYMRMALIGEGSEYPGADVVGQWYTRNLRIYANIRRLIHSPDDRLLVLFGQGHAFLLQQYIADSGDLALDQFTNLK